MKTTQISRDEQVARLVATMIEAGLVLKCEGPWGAHTVGPYVKAVGPATFAAFGYGRNVPDGYRHREGSAVEAARIFVSSVGAPRARETARRGSVGDRLLRRPVTAPVPTRVGVNPAR